MLTAKSRESSKKKAEGTPAGPKSKAETVELFQANPLWTQLATRVQAKLTVSAPDDPYEREADRVADQVIRMPDRPSSNHQLSFSSVRASTAQRKCTACEEEEQKLQRKESGTAADAPATAPPIVHEALSTPGQPLDSATRAFFEPRFSWSFSDIRVHADPNAAASARAVNALAFTLGHDLVFGEGQYAPRTLRGQQLLAHELAHVLQQKGTGNQVQRYEAYEHAELGDKARLAEKHIIQGVEVTSGEINALGDYYATLDDLMNADAGELKELIKLIRQQKANPASVSESDWDRATKGRYTELNLRNRAHFGPQKASLIAPQASTSPGVDNISTWTSYHKDALQMARQAGAAVDPAARRDLLANAKIVNAFGEHYLGDAFSAGHLFNKDDTVAIIQTNIKALSKKDLELTFKYAADWIWGIPDLRKLISQYETPGLGFDINSADRFKSVLEGVHKKKPEAVANAIVKYVHDKLSTWQEGGIPGLQVENDYGTWLLSGDKTLRGNTVTQDWAVKAIEAARSNVLTASQDTTNRSTAIPSDADMVKQVLAFVPRPTKTSTTIIHDLLAKVTDPKNRVDFATAVAQVVAGELPSILDQIVAAKELQKITP